MNAESTLASALQEAAVYRQPTHFAGSLTVDNVASMLDREFADLVVSIEPPTSFVVFAE